MLVRWWRAFGFFATFIVLAAASSEDPRNDDRLTESHRSITAHLHHLGQCRRQFTFLASAALGAFITRVVKESPLTPLPLPPLKDSLRWNLVSVPAHLVAPFYQTIKRHPGGQDVHLNQGIGSLGESGSLFRSQDSLDPLSSDWKEKIIRSVIKMRLSEDLVTNAVQRTLKPLKFILPHAIGMRHWLLRWCR